MLFKGNPYLIQGFNTFLPPGYRIEISSDVLSNAMITVTTPLGVLTHSTGVLATPMRLPREPPFPGPLGHTFPSQPSYPAPPPILPVGLGPGSRPASPIGAHGMPHNPSAFVDAPPPSYSPAIHGAQTTAAANFLGILGNRAVEKPQAGEFNHAIQFLNKIKVRFADEPDTYKQFLEILQTYQKEQRQLHDVCLFVHLGYF